MQWFYAKNGQQIGPVTLDQLKALVSSGQVAKTDMVWRDGMANWLPAGEVPELAVTVASAAGSAVPPIPTGNYSSMASSSSPQFAREIPNYLVQSILVTLFCCLPLGIVSIVFAAQVNSKVAAGDYAGAQKASDQAK